VKAKKKIVLGQQDPESAKKAIALGYSTDSFKAALIEHLTEAKKNALTKGDIEDKESLVATHKS
jgi:hypothetical protein